MQHLKQSLVILPYSPLFLKSPVKFLYSPIPMMAEKNQEEAPMPSCSLEKDPIQDNTRFKLSWSISLSRIDQDSSNQEGSSQSSNTKKRKEPPSPKGKFCVKDTEAKFELANTFAELKGEINQVEERVTSKLLSEIEPSMSGMRDQIQSSIGADIRRLVQEELAIQKMNEVKEQEAVDDEVEDPVSTKNNKIQKIRKIKIPIILKSK